MAQAKKEKRPLLIADFIPTAHGPAPVTLNSENSQNQKIVAAWRFYTTGNADEKSTALNWLKETYAIPPNITPQTAQELLKLLVPPILPNNKAEANLGKHQGLMNLVPQVPGTMARLSEEMRMPLIHALQAAQAPGVTDLAKAQANQKIKEALDNARLNTLKELDSLLTQEKPPTPADTLTIHLLKQELRSLEHLLKMPNPATQCQRQMLFSKDINTDINQLNKLISAYNKVLIQIERIEEDKSLDHNHSAVLAVLASSAKLMLLNITDKKQQIEHKYSTEDINLNYPFQYLFQDHLF